MAFLSTSDPSADFHGFSYDYFIIFVRPVAHILQTDCSIKTLEYNIVCIFFSNTLAKIFIFFLYPPLTPAHSRCNILRVLLLFLLRIRTFIGFFSFLPILFAHVIPGLLRRRLFVFVERTIFLDYRH